MRFESQCFWLAKDAEFPEQYQDAYQLDGRRGLAAIADGVSSALFSGPWARTLVQGALAEPPPLDDAERFRDWLTRQRTELAGQIDVTKLTWYQRPKFAAGAMSTLLWIELTPLSSESLSSESPEVLDSPETSQLPNAYRLQGYSIGDCCLFHLRDGQLLRSFPMSGSEEFGLDPKVLVSIDRQQDHLLEFQQFDDACLPGDLLVLCTDAIGLWALTLLEQGEQVAWDAYWDRSPQSWADEIFELRRGKHMRYDDTTLLLLRVIEETADPIEETPAIVPVESTELPLPPLPADDMLDLDMADADDPSATAILDLAVEPPCEDSPTMELLDGKQVAIRSADVEQPEADKTDAPSIDTADSSDDDQTADDD